MKTGFRIIAAVIGIIALGLQGAELTKWTIEFFCFFTILTNCLVALAMALPAIFPGTSLGRFFDRPSVRTAIAGYIIIVAMVYHLVLRTYWNPQGWGKVADVLLHYVTPTLFVLDWLLFVPKGSVPWSAVAKALVFPLIYICWTLWHGAQTGFYPYPFVDVAELGLQKVAMNSAGLFGVFLAVTTLLTLLNRLLGRVMGSGAETATS
jgi:hypothetical protein